MGIIQRLLEKLATASKEELGTKRLDCCDLNKQKNSSEKKSTRK